MSLQYLKQEVRDEADFSHADKHQSWFQHFGYQSFLEVDTIIIDGHDPAFSKCSNYQVCNIFTISHRRSSRRTGGYPEVTKILYFAWIGK